MSEHIGETDGEFSVWQFSSPEFGDVQDCVRRHVGPQEAVEAFRFYTSNVAARMGMTSRVIIIDAGDCINMEWQYGKGITYDGKERA
jgi:hypothetical protein